MTDATAPPRGQATHRILVIIGFQLALVALLILLGIQYSWMHNVPHPLSPIFGDATIDTYAEGITNFNFVGRTDGNPPSIFAVILEVAIWSFAGVLARLEFNLAQIVVHNREFSFLKELSRIIGDASMGVAIAIAVVAFLWSTEFVNMTLKDAEIGSIGAISFILGFYHEDTRRLLGSLRHQMPGRVRDENGEEDAQRTGSLFRSAQDD